MDFIQNYNIRNIIVDNLDFINLVKIFSNIIKFTVVLKLFLEYRNIYLFWFENTDFAIYRTIVLISTIYQSNYINHNIQIKKYIHILTNIFLILLNFYSGKYFDTIIGLVYLYYIIKSNNIINYIKNTVNKIAITSLKKQVIGIFETDDSFNNLIQNINRLITNVNSMVDIVKNTTPTIFMQNIITCFESIQIKIEEIVYYIDASKVRNYSHNIFVAVFLIFGYLNFPVVINTISIWRLFVNIIFTVVYLWKIYKINNYGIDTSLIENLNKFIFMIILRNIKRQLVCLSKDIKQQLQFVMVIC